MIHRFRTRASTYYVMVYSRDCWGVDVTGLISFFGFVPLGPRIPKYFAKGKYGLLEDISKLNRCLSLVSVIQYKQHKKKMGSRNFYRRIICISRDHKQLAPSEDS